jgi:hypothetical protein
MQLQLPLNSQSAMQLSLLLNQVGCLRLHLLIPPLQSVITLADRLRWSPWRKALTR